MQALRKHSRSVSEGSRCPRSYTAALLRHAADFFERGVGSCLGSRVTLVTTRCGLVGTIRGLIQHCGDAFSACRYELSEKQLRGYFVKFGVLSDLYLPKHANGRNKGYGFATYASSESLALALQHPKHVVNGITVQVLLLSQAHPYYVLRCWQTKLCCRSRELGLALLTSLKTSSLQSQKLAMFPLVRAPAFTLVECINASQRLDYMSTFQNGAASRTYTFLEPVARRDPTTALSPLTTVAMLSVPATSLGAIWTAGYVLPGNNHAYTCCINTSQLLAIVVQWVCTVSTSFWTICNGLTG